MTFCYKMNLPLRPSGWPDFQYRGSNGTATVQRRAVPDLDPTTPDLRPRPVCSAALIGGRPGMPVSDPLHSDNFTTHDINFSIHLKRKLCYRKDDRAMHPNQQA